MDHGDLIGRFDRRQPVRDGNAGDRQGFQGAGDDRLGGCIEGACGFIQQQNLGLAQ